MIRPAANLNEVEYDAWVRQVWKSTTRNDGRFTVWLRPRISGAIVVGYSGSATVQFWN